MRLIKEDTVEDYFVNQFKDAFPDAQVHKYEARRSEPDRICLMPGPRTIFVELKRPGKDLRPEQVRAFKRLHNMGYEAYVANTKPLVDGLIKALLRGVTNGNA